MAAPCAAFVRAVLLLLCLVPLVSSAEALRVLVVLSDAAAPYQAFAKTFRQNLPVSIKTSLIERAEDFSGDEGGADLIVTVGVKASYWVTQRTTTPVLAALIPSSRYAELLAKHPRTSQLSAIYLDQPWARQAGLLRAALPERRNIGVLYSADTKLDLRALKEALSRQGFTLIAKLLKNNDTLFADLEEVLENSDVLLAIPDGTIYSSNHIRNILLSSYRRGIPLMGSSQAYVNAGALCAIFSTPEHLAAQASVATLVFADTHRLPEAKYPELYSIAVNREVGRTLNITIKSTELLQFQVEKTQGNL
ncbi:MAG TPA: ABC transporter substrate binding protein [Gallionella sp.]|nr:ABC transporter substrate binding protein [Gallionella sp.]